MARGDCHGLPSRYFRRKLARCKSVGEVHELIACRGQVTSLLAKLERDGSQPKSSSLATTRLPLKFNRDFIQKSGLPQLTLHAPQNLITVYRDSQKQSALLTMVQELKVKNCIREMHAHEKGFFSRVFLVPKKSGGWRLVIDLSTLNTYLSQVTFSMDTLKVVKETAQAGMWATSLDLSDAYHHIPIRQDSQVFLCFQIGEQRFMYLVLPFGLSTAPWVFTEVVKQIKVWSMAQQLVLFQYLDDWLNLFLSFDQAVALTQKLLELCERLGLMVNAKKSELAPKQSIIFLGERLDFSQLRAFPTEERQQAIVPKLRKAIEDKHLLFPKAESLLGLMTATFPTIPLGRLHMRPFQREVIKVIRRGRDPRAQVQVRGHAILGLNWWLIPHHWTQGTRFQPPPPEITVFTDASTKGWGVVCGEDSWNGKWQREKHINWLELRTVLVAIQLLRLRLRNKCVLFLIDNTSAVAYLNKEGGTKSYALMKLTTRILSLAHAEGITIVAKHIAGQNNVLADLASRMGQVIPAEWTLTQEAFGWLVRQSPWGPPTLEMFANQANHLLKRYFSPCEDSQAIATDALQCRWPREVMYAFPPLALTVSIPETIARGTEISNPPSSQRRAAGQVASTTAPASHQTKGVISNVVPATPAASLGPHPPTARDPEPHVDSFGEEYLKSQGFSPNVIERIRNSRAASTRKHYKSQWDLFVGWAVRKQLDPLNASLPLLADFLEYLFKVRQVSVRTILNYKSAISFYWKSQIGYELPENDHVIGDLVRGFKRERPIPHKHVVDWDIRLVLSFFQSGKFKDWDRLSDKELTLKTVFLVALATGKRRSELHAISKNFKWIKGDVRKIELSPVPEFLSKTHLATAGLGAFKPIALTSLDDFAGPEGKEERLLCPVRALAYYIKRSSEYRTETQEKLFISYRRGMSKDISKQTISSYIKEAIILAYQSSGTEQAGSIHIKPHSVRHVATSLSALKHYSMEDVLRAGAWTTSNVFLSFYMQDFSTESISKLSRLGGFVAAGTHF